MKKTILFVCFISGLFLVGCGQSGQKEYEKGRRTKDITEQIQWYEKAAEKGHAGAQLELGVIYLGHMSHTEGMRDLEKAEKWLRKAAASNDRNAKERAETNLSTLDSMKKSENSLHKFLNGKL